MKLDRNLNPDGVGKYALLRLRELDKIRQRGQSESGIDYAEVVGAIDTLKRAGMIHWGDEGDGEQFFVLKYKDKFSPAALEGYIRAIDAEIESLIPKAFPDDSMMPDVVIARQMRSLSEFNREIHGEYLNAISHGKRIPD